MRVLDKNVRTYFIFVEIAQVRTRHFKDLDKLNLVKLTDGDLVLGSRQVLIQPQLPYKMKLASKDVKSDSQIIISLCHTESVTYSVEYEKYLFF